MTIDTFMFRITNTTRFENAYVFILVYIGWWWTYLYTLDDELTCIHWIMV